MRWTRPRPAASLRAITVIGVLTSVSMLLHAIPAQAAFPGTNGELAFERAPKIGLINPDGTDLRVLHPGFSPAFSPDGTKVAFDWTRSREGIFTMDAGGGGLRQLTFRDPHNGDAYPAWSPDGSRIAFVRCEFAIYGCQIFVMNADGTAPHPVTGLDIAGFDTSPDWSPDGSRIAFTCGAGICTIDPDGTGLVRLTDNADDWADWSPDGTRILFTRLKLDGSDGDLWVMNADGTGQVNLTNDATDEEAGAWSPDGTLIAYSHEHGAIGTIFIMNADGTNRIKLCGDASTTSRISWQPIPSVHS